MEHFHRVYTGLCALFYLFILYKIIKQPNGEGTREVPFAEDCSDVAPRSGRGAHIEPSVSQAPVIKSNTLKQNSIQTAHAVWAFLIFIKIYFLRQQG